MCLNNLGSDQMFERMLDKKNQPSFEEMVAYTLKLSSSFKEINNYIKSKYETTTLIKFPYGNNYGWGVKHEVKTKHFCYVFPEVNSFTVMIRLLNKNINQIKDNLDDYSKLQIENMYPCGQGGWLHYRVISDENMNDLKKIINVK